MPNSLVIQRPEAADHLMLLFHGVGATADHLVPLGRTLAESFPRAIVASVAAPQAADHGAGYQWFSIRKITNENRVARVAAAMTGFLAAIAEWQSDAHLGPADTTLVGFSQGGIMALESLQQPHLTAGRIVSIAGRFAQAPLLASPATIHLLHGESDKVIPCGYSTLAAQQLKALGIDVTVDLVPRLGHEINGHVARVLLARLRGLAPE